MSTLAVGTIKSISSAAPVFQNTSGTEKGQLVKAWVNFDGTFGTSPFTKENGGIRDAFNVSSINDEGTGLYTINFATAMSDTNYCEIGNSSVSGTNFGAYLVPVGDSNSNYPRTTAKFSVTTVSYAAFQDVAYNFIAVFAAN